MDFRYLKESDQDQLEDLIAYVEANLPDEMWWPPIRDEVRSHFFDHSWTRIIGCFDNDALVAAACLFLEPFVFTASAEAAGLAPAVVAEIGRCMVRPSKRGANLMLSMSKQLLDCAYLHGQEWVIAAVHPDNAAGCRSLERLGMSERARIVQSDVYPRIIYGMQI